MQLIYRGINYQHQPLQIQNSNNLEIPGKYRGVEYNISPTTEVSLGSEICLKSMVIYKYRGVNYIKGYC